MLPDTLPILGNGCGDSLCLRFAGDGTLSEVVYWCHEGATWHPYGKTFSEAVLLDAAIQSESEPDVELIDWAIGWLGLGTREQETLRNAYLGRRSDILDVLLESQLAETAIRKEYCERNCSSNLLTCCRQRGGQNLADSLGVPWSEFGRWLFDTRLVPENQRMALERATGIAVDDLLRQNWEAAAYEAEKVAQKRSDLTWPYAVLGWASERNGDLDSAVKWYFSGLRSLASTAGFTEQWSLRDAYGETKFVAERLSHHRGVLPPDVLDDKFVVAVKDAGNRVGLLNAVPKFWRDMAALAERENRPRDAYQNYYRAGWDVYVYDFDDLEIILVSLSRHARTAGTESLARIAEHHLRALQALYDH